MVHLHPQRPIAGAGDEDAAVAARLKAIHVSEVRGAARAKVVHVVAQLYELKQPAAATLVRDHIEEMLSYDAFPGEHQRSLRPTSPLERIMQTMSARLRGDCLRTNMPVATGGHVEQASRLPLQPSDGNLLQVLPAPGCRLAISSIRRRGNVFNEG